MQIIYLHGFRSNPMSKKGQQLRRYCANHDQFQVHLPDLNLSPDEVLQKISGLIESLPRDQVVLVGSSLGGFYATYFVAKYGCSAVLINPAMQPWQLFQDLFGIEQIPLKVTESWTLDTDQLQQLQLIANTRLNHADKILVLLQQGDEVLDYRQAQRYYGAAQPSSLILTDMGGNHAMDDFEEKLPLVLEFLSAALQ
ncbi:MULTISPECIES: YqiA/YcfP family alpha/beta fold hydrolase [unclassified Acinetobacter]|uniref:YqiA/YcfP family alpha/beta fold hydrolase n=1 Tax=unclassified Acinetobacter TaxID=196816 RepID=UPI00244D5D9F|nr:MULTISPECIES: YqiA/YcfP family alpha/beta fold hydrolase [unclassified Acinetobacter]MDH0032499.1 esterase [Acinetobacter sp. GD04021]MDH0888090.1 esterase [Acinetobacter sp. GD03873]MDH1084374.1 esterase [Acinetobacter sp. GD03983]MDH2191395.1 esterase [Acinetobacter sp. GD03645]MDH2204944.1 esterase [Acinetobacter sp. GD03647]